MLTRMLFLGAGIFLGAILYFLLGTVFASDQSSKEAQSPRNGHAPELGGSPVGRQVFSPSIKNDPFVVSEWRKTVESLERQCKEYGQLCVEARKARAAMDDVG